MLRPSQIQDFYQRMGVGMDTTLQQIKSAYRKLARQYHPDKNKGSLEASLDFVAVNEAYGILSDSEKRQRYDASAKAHIEISKKPKSKKESAVETLANLCIYIDRQIPLSEFIPIYESFNRINMAVKRIKEQDINSKLAERLIHDIDYLKQMGDKYETDFKTLKRLSRLFVEAEKAARRYNINLRDLVSLVSETQY